MTDIERQAVAAGVDMVLPDSPDTAAWAAAFLIGGIFHITLNRSDCKFYCVPKGWNWGIADAALRNTWANRDVVGPFDTLQEAVVTAHLLYGGST